MPSSCSAHDLSLTVENVVPIKSFVVVGVIIFLVNVGNFLLSVQNGISVLENEVVNVGKVQRDGHVEIG